MLKQDTFWNNYHEAFLVVNLNINAFMQSRQRKIALSLIEKNLFSKYNVLHNEWHDLRKIIIRLYQPSTVL